MMDTLPEALKAIGLAIAIDYLKKFFCFIQHPRYRTRFFLLLILLSTIYVGRFFELVQLNNLRFNVAFILLVLLYVLLFFLSTRKPILFSGFNLKRLRFVLDSCLDFDCERYYFKKPWYLIDFVERYHYRLLQADWFFRMGQNAKAYETLESIKESKLFPDERFELDFQKVKMLICLGCLKKASDLLEKRKNNSDPNYLFAKALISEGKGDYGACSDYFQDALNNVSSENKESILKTKIYNNYGRIRLIENNYQDAVYYFSKCHDLSKKLNRKDLVNASYQNLIIAYQSEGRSEKVEHLIKEYCSFVNFDNTLDLFDFYNFKLSLARQSNNKAFLIQSVIYDYEILKDRVSGNKRLCLDIGHLRIVLNSGLMNDKLLSMIFSNLDKCFSMEMPDKYFALKEMHGAFKQLGNNCIQRYKEVFDRIDQYMKSNALSELEDYICKLQDFETHQRYIMEKEVVAVLKSLLKPYSFNLIYERLTGVKEGLIKNALNLDAEIIDLDIVDECFSLENCPDQRILSQQISEVANQHLRLADENISNRAFSPAYYEFYLRLAIYFLMMKNDVRAQHFYDNLKKCKISINHFADWLQGYYGILYNRFE